MIKKLLFTTSAFFLFTSFLSAQTFNDDGATIGDIQCQNLDQSQLDIDLEDFFDGFIWSSDCASQATYIAATFTIIDMPPWNCGDNVELEVDLDCEGSSTTIQVFLDVIDDLPPVFTDPGVYDFPYECGDSGSDPQTELDDWITNIENNAFADGNIDDDCDLANITVSAINGPYIVNLTSCSNNEVQEIVVDFEMEDECGNTDEFTATFTIEDTVDPVDFDTDSSLNDPNLTGQVCDIMSSDQLIQDWIDDILMNGALTGSTYFSDECGGPLVITLDNTNLPSGTNQVALDYTQCVEGGGNYEATFIIEDQCGNQLTETYQYEIIDQDDPVFAPGDGFYDMVVNPCDENNGGNHNQDFADWVNNTIQDMINNGDITDNCYNVTIADIVPDVTSINIDFDDCDQTEVHEETVTFTITDACGNSIDTEHTWTLIDDIAPVINIAGWSQATPFPECDDLSSIETAVVSALTSGVLMEGCADLSSLTINDFMLDPDPSGLTIDDLTFVTNAPNGCFQIEIEAVYEDPCGNVSAPALFLFQVDDNTGPDLSSIDCPSVNAYCPAEIMSEQDILDELFGGSYDGFLEGVSDECTGIADFQVEIFDDSGYDLACGDMGFIEYEIFDRCGNPAFGSPCTASTDNIFRVEWEISNNNVNQLDWIGQPEDFLPPGDFTIQYTDANCTNEFDMMPASGMCMWEGILDGEDMIEVWNFQVIEGMHFEGGCDVSVNYSHVPCLEAFDLPQVENQMPAAELVNSEINSVLDTEVCVTVTDECTGFALEYCFTVTVQCGSCGQFGNIFCATCEESDVPIEDGGCRLCDPEQLAEGYQSCTPPCTDPACPILGPPQPGLLCDTGGFVPHNMSWFAFVASSEESEVEVFIFNCVGAGVQSGIYNSCDFDEPCVGFDVECNTNGTITYDANFEIGQTYYMFVDGCNGSECEYEVTVEGLNELVPDGMDHITAFSACKNEILTNDFSRGQENASVSGDCDAADKIFVCPGELIQFDVRHQGDFGNFPDNDAPCDKYAVLDATFQWSASWGANFEWNPAMEDDSEETIELVEVPMDVGIYNICLDFIDYECFPVTGPVCLEIEVEAIPLEQFEYAVCIEELDGTNEPRGWDSTLITDDPNGDGIPWLGDFFVTADEVRDTWTDRGDGFMCMDWIFVEPTCNCEVPQELCIDIVGDEDKTPVFLYLWECQVTECRDNRPNDCEPVPYDWTWDWRRDEEVVELHGENSVNPGRTEDMCFRIPGYHEHEDDWRPGGPRYCDTIPLVTVFTAEPTLNIDTLGCGAYCLDMDQTFDDFADDFEDWPQPFQNFTQVSFIDCDNGDLIQQGECLFLTSPRDDVCISVLYQFEDGAWVQDGETTHPFGPIIEECSTILGPFDWGVEAPNPPVVTGDDTFCATALTGHVFNIVNPIPGETYIWNQNPVMPGVVVTPNNPEATEVIIDLPAGWGPNDCTNVFSMGNCDPSEPTQVCFNLLAPPTVELNPITDVCVTTAPDGQAVTVAEVSAVATPTSPNYEYTWMNPGPTTTLTNSTTFSYPSAGTQTVTVAVTDTTTNCMSLVSAPVMFEVEAPLDPPAVTCGEQGQTELEVIWTEVPGATGYRVFVEGVAVTPDFGPGDFTYTETGLTLGETRNFTVMSLGAAPCFNSAQSQPTPCVTTTCPAAGVMQDLSSVTPFSFCENDTRGILDLAAAFPFTDPNGALAFNSASPAVDPVTGEFNTDGLAAGTYDIQVVYSFDQLCPVREFNLQYIVTPVPDPNFEIESPICATTAAAITGMPAGVVFDFDGGIPNTDGEIEWTEAGTYTIKAVANLGGCLDSTTREVVVEPQLEPAIIECPLSGLDFVNFEWEDVDGATGYIVTTEDPVNGIVTRDPFTETELSLVGLNENDFVLITVTAVSDFAGCNSTATSDCTATACEQFPGLSFNQCDEVPGMVTFSWNAITGIDSFIVTELATGDVTRQTELDYTINGLGQQESASISVEPIHPTFGCFLPARELTCTAPCADEPVMGPVTCTASGLDFVEFDWEDVDGVDDYFVSISVNGRPPTEDTIQVSNTTGFDFLSQLEQDDRVEISVIALNPDQNCNNSDESESFCIASSCITPTFNIPAPTFCWQQGNAPIQLEIGDVLNPMGNVMQGTIIWDDNSVDADGMFTPSSANSRLYDIDFVWIDAMEPDACTYDLEIEVQINIRPVVDLDLIPTVCIGDPSVINVTNPSGDPAVTYEFDFAGGDVVDGMGSGPYNVEFTEMSTVSVVASSASDCMSDPATAVAEIDLPGFFDITCGAATNSTVTFEWDFIDGVIAYNVSIDGGPMELILQEPVNLFTAEGVSGDVEITVIAVTDSPNMCGEISATMTCTTQNCPPSVFPDFGADNMFDAGCINDATGFTLPGSERLQNPPTTDVVEETWESHPTVDPATGEFNPDLVVFTSGEETIDITYTVTYSDGIDPCTYTTDYQITVADNPSLTFEINDPDCIADEVPSVTLTGNGGTGPYMYSWIGDPSRPAQSEQEFIIPAPGEYDMVVTDANGCTGNILIPILAAPDTTVTIEGPSQIFIGDTETFEVILMDTDLEVEVSNIIWYINGIPVDSDGSTVDIEGLIEVYGPEFDVRVEVYFSEDCFAQDDIRVSIIDVERWFIPNVFSPTLGGEDAQFNMFTKGSVTVQDVAIYDRWGELVYTKQLDPMLDREEIQTPDGSSHKWNLGWSGVWGEDLGAAVEIGVYVYVINLVVDEGGADEFSEIEAGDVTVIR